MKKTGPSAYIMSSFTTIVPSSKVLGVSECQLNNESIFEKLCSTISLLEQMDISDDMKKEKKNFGGEEKERTLMVVVQHIFLPLI